MKKALVAAVGSLLIATHALADESPAASTSTEPVVAARALAVTGDATPTITTPQTDTAAVRKSRRAAADDAANKSEASQVKQLPLKAPNDGTVCRREQPTGSRISVKHCYSMVTDTAASKVQNEIMQRDIQEMRDRQIYDQLQRASVGMTPAMRSPPSR